MNKIIKQAFTLIELLVVIAIIGILSGLIVVTMSGVTQKANIAKAQIFSNSLRNALMLNIISEWKFDELTTAVDGTTVRDSWGVNNGILDINSISADTTNKVKSGSDCVSGKCLFLDGIDDYIDIATSSTLKPVDYITLSGWAHSDNWGGIGDSRLLSCTEAGGYNIAFNGDAINSLASIRRNGSYATITYSLNVLSNGWHFFTATYDGRYFKTYIDGSLAGTPNDAGANYPIQYTYNNSLIIGGESSSGTGAGMGFFQGEIDEVRVYNAAIPASQVKEQYYAGLNKLLTNGSISGKEYVSMVK